MMFERFLQRYPVSGGLSVQEAGKADLPLSAGVRELIDRFGGMSFGGGVYRIPRATDQLVWGQRVTEAFPSAQGRVTCFGYDWLGRVFAVDPLRTEQGLPGVVMFEPGTGESLKIPANIVTFHDEELVDYADAALAIDTYAQWRAAGRAAPEHHLCVGYQRPLFLGGADTLDNLEISDLDVYWHLMSQLIRQTRGLPNGTRVRLSSD